MRRRKGIKCEKRAGKYMEEVRNWMKRSHAYLGPKNNLVGNSDDQSGEGEEEVEKE